MILEPAPNEATEDWSPAVVETALDVDLPSLTARATLQIVVDDSTAASLDVGGLAVTTVRVNGENEDWQVDDGRLDVALPLDGGTATVVVDYSFEISEPFEGLMDSGSTLTWPYYCGNLFPCRPHPSEGSRLRLDVTANEGETVIFADDTVSAAPAYQLAWATAPLELRELGTTPAGTQVEVWASAEGAAAAAVGTADLLPVVGWLEDTLGPYPFGDRMGPVEVVWQAGAFGGMEHHPLWHVAAVAMGDSVVHAHEAAHGWFGAGVRLACWEDFVLSEGTVSYLAARALGQVVGPEREAEVWESYRSELSAILNGPLSRDYVVWPDSCGELDVLDDGLFGRAAYMKGAWFYRDVAEEIGAESLDLALAAVFVASSGEAARMQDVLDAIQEVSGFDPSSLAEAWLRTEGAPEGWDARR